MRESLDNDAEKITEHSICAEVQGPRGGTLTPQNNAFSSLGKILLQTVAKLDISPILIGCLFWQVSTPS